MKGAFTLRRTFRAPCTSDIPWATTGEYFGPICKSFKTMAHLTACSACYMHAWASKWRLLGTRGQRDQVRSLNNIVYHRCVKKIKTIDYINFCPPSLDLAKFSLFKFKELDLSKFSRTRTIWWVSQRETDIERNLSMIVKIRNKWLRNLSPLWTRTLFFFLI